MATNNSESLIDSVYARLRDLIISNELRGGQKLVDRDLADTLGVSRTPIREALGRLTVMGLVEARSRRGYYVRQYTADQMSDLYEFRKILEVNAARLAAQHASPAHLQEFHRLLVESEKLTADAESRARTVEIDLQIHDLVARASGNVSLHQAIGNLMDKVTCLIWVDWLGASLADPVSIAAAHSEHRALLLSIVERDAECAAECMGTHIDNAREGLASVLQARDDLRNALKAGTASTKNQITPGA